MNILYLISYAGKAGSEKYVADLMRLFRARGCSCHLAYQEGGRLSEEAEADGFAVHHLDLRPQHLLSAARAVARLCETQQIDVIHAQYPRENVIAVLSRLYRRETRVVFTSHLTIRQGFAWRLINRLITPHDAAVISVCRSGAELLRQNGVRPDKIIVIPNGVKARPIAPRTDTLRRELGLSEDTFIFFSMARFAPEKGLGFLAESLALLKKLSPLPFVCAVAGDGEEFAAVGEKAAALGLENTFIRLGYRRDTDALLRSADGYVSSALYNEAMSFAILEAMENTLPLVVTTVGAGPELAEGCGYAVAPGDTEAMAKALCALLTDRALCRRLGEAARRRTETEFDLDVLAERIAAVYSPEGSA